MNSRQFAQGVRERALNMVHAANASHIGGVLSMADLLGVLYVDILRLAPADPCRPERDRFVLSKGHCCAGVYASLALKGFISEEELATYGRDGSRLMTHVSHKVPGVEFSTGSLGHGLPFACGKALAAKKRGFSWRTVVMMSDGELNEGSNWEAILFAPQHKLDNLTVIVDYNRIQSLGPVEEVIELEPLGEKFRSFRWSVREIDGHDHSSIRAALAAIPWEVGKPNCLIARTVKGKGVDYMENNLRWHYSAPKVEQLADAVAQVRRAT